MSGWLLDTDVLSAFAPGRPTMSSEQRAWFRDRAGTLFLSAVSAMEIETGIARLQRSGSAAREAALREWFDRALDQFADRILPFDLVAARVAGTLSEAAQAGGRHPGFADIAIASIAISRDLVILTRNLRHFGPLGVSATDPFEITRTR